MLGKVSLEEIAKLRLAPGKEVAVLVITTCEPGTIVRVKTASENVYFFEVTDPIAHRAHVVRCDSRGLMSSGYQGEQLVSPMFRIGDRLMHGFAVTSAIAGITILQ